MGSFQSVKRHEVMDMIDLRIKEEQIDQKLKAKIDHEEMDILASKFHTSQEQLSKLTNICK